VTHGTLQNLQKTLSFQTATNKLSPHADNEPLKIYHDSAIELCVYDVSSVFRDDKASCLTTLETFYVVLQS
jgi:hypothetical protein